MGRILRLSWMRRSRCRRDREFSALKMFVHILTYCSAGGVSIIGGQGKIALPAVREILFGKNENRKFTN